LGCRFSKAIDIKKLQVARILGSGYGIDIIENSIRSDHELSGPATGLGDATVLELTSSMRGTGVPKQYLQLKRWNRLMPGGFSFFGLLMHATEPTGACVMNSISAENSRSHEGPPAFGGFPYMATYVVSGLNHIILLPMSEDYGIFRLRDIARAQAGLNRLPTCLVINWDQCLYVRPDGTEQDSTNIPKAAWVEYGKLLPDKPFPETGELRSRRLMLQKFSENLKSCKGQGQPMLMGDLTKGGRIRRPEDGPLKGFQQNGVPKGLRQCSKCREWKGECFDAPLPLVVHVHCTCENDNLCAACRRPLYSRKLNANYYSESDRGIWHVPAFCAFDHTCGYSQAGIH
jgi:hypothetical protein